MYAKGMSTRAISEFILEMYAMEISATEISRITEKNLLAFEEMWGKKYPIAAKSWLDNWINLSTFFEYDQQLRKTNSTTNPIEGMHCQIHKITKSNGAFSSEQALMKLMFLIINDISKKWTMPVHNWCLTISPLYIKFGIGSNLIDAFRIR